MPFLLFIATLPLIIALGHDLYLFYTFPENDSYFATIGWIWATYHKDSLKATAEFIVDNAGKETWEMLVPVLTCQAALVGAIIAALVYIPCGLFKMMNSGGKRRSSDASERLLERHKSKKMKYKRG